MIEPDDRSIEILRLLAPHSILVGSAAHSDEFNDIDLLIEESFFPIAKEVLRGLHPDSCFPGHIKTWDTFDPVEVFVYWYGPAYDEIPITEIGAKIIHGVYFRTWEKSKDFWG